MAGGYPCKCCRRCRFEFGEELADLGETCGACVDGRAPGVWKVVLAGIFNNGCSDCDQLNGTYFLCNSQRNPSSCDWEYLFELDGDGPICGFTALRLVVVASFPAGIFVGLHAGAHHADWRKSYPIGANPDCLANDLDIPRAPLFTTGGASDLCDFSLSTCTVES